MAEEQVEVVDVGEGVGVGQELLHVVGDLPTVALENGAARFGELSVVGVRHLRTAGFVERHASVEGQFQALVQGEIGKTVGHEGIALVDVFVELNVLQVVALAAVGAQCAAVAAVAGIVHLESVLVDHNVAVAVAHVDRIDRRHADRRGECVSAVGVAFALTVAVVVGLVAVVPDEMGVGHVTADFQPLFGLVVRAQTGGVALVARTVDDTRVVQIAERCEEIGAVRRAGNADVVLLTERRRFVDFVEPVVGLQVELLALGVGYQAALLRTRIETAVFADEVLAVGHGEDVVTQTAGIVRRQQLVGGDVGGQGSVLLVERVIVVQRLVVHLVVFARILHDVVGLQRTGVDAPLAVESHGGLAGLRTLGRDHDYAVRAAGAVQGVRRGVLEDADRLDVGSVDVVDVAFVGHAVYNPERVVFGIHRTVAAHVNLLTGTRTARGGGELHAGDFADEGIPDVRRLRFYQIVGFDHLRRSGEGVFLGCTEGHYDHVVDGLCVFFERDVDSGLASDGHLLGFIADEGYDQRSVSGSRDGEATVSV